MARRLKLPRSIALAGCISLAFAIHAAQPLEGKVIVIHDGDSLSLLADGRRIKVRLAEIDAPETTQSFGRQSRQSLSNLCFKKVAMVEQMDTDRYGNIVGQVKCDGVDASAAQVERGMAWVYMRYAKSNSPLWFLQDKAQRSREGLWAEAYPIAPSRFRQR